MNYLVVLPHVYSVSLAVAIFICYLGGIGYEHFSPLLPYLSDIYANSPEKGVFQLISAVLSLILLVIVYIRYQQWHMIIDSWAYNRAAQREAHRKRRSFLFDSTVIFQTNTREEMHRANQFAMSIGYTAAISLLALTSVRILDSYIVHNFFLFIFFVMNCVYFCYQTHFSGKFVDIVNTENLYCARFWLTTIEIIAVSVHIIIDRMMLIIIGSAVSKYEYRATMFMDSGTYFFFIISALSQWAVFIANALYIYSFNADFGRITLEKLKLGQEFKGHMPLLNYQALYKTQPKETLEGSGKITYITEPMRIDVRSNKVKTNLAPDNFFLTYGVLCKKTSPDTMNSKTGFDNTKALLSKKQDEELNLIRMQAHSTKLQQSNTETADNSKQTLSKISKQGTS